MDSVRVSEPVTPPTSSHSNTLYNKAHHGTSGIPGSNGAVQLSPNLVMRDQSVASLGYNTGNTFMASPAEGSMYGNAARSYLATPNTPKQSRANSQTFTSTPFGPLAVGSRNSLPQGSGTHSRQPSQSHMTSHLPQHGPGNPVVAGGMTPLGHARSYSYNLMDPQASLSRLSISGQPPAAGTAATADTLRPRAYSFGIPGNLNAPYGSSDTNTHAFPAPLSSPISPDTMMNGPGVASRLGQRSYSHAFTPSSGTEDPFASTNLYRSVSTASIKAPSRVHSDSSSTSLGNHSIASGVSNEFSAVPPATMPSLGQKTSPTYAPKPFRPRRSSSSGSSVDLNFAGVVGNAGVFPGLVNLGKDLSGPQVDLDTCTDAEIYALCRDQRGCRFLQRKLVESNADIVHRIFDATSPHIVTLMADPFGNYFCQKLFELCNDGEILTLLSVAAPALPYIATNQHGTRALQRLIDAMTTNEQLHIVINALDGHVVRLIRDINGNHVIQKLLLTLDDTGSQFIYDAVCQSVVEIGSHRHGCCVLQRCLDYSTETNRRKLVSHIVAQSVTLVCDPFGNYVCQYVIDLRVQEFTDALVQQLLGKVAALSVQKFSSNVVEKCIREASPVLQKAVVSELMVPGTLNELLLDNYGNYVIQTALESMTSMASLDTSTRQNISRDICAALTETRSPYGRRIMSKLKAW